MRVPVQQRMIARRRGSKRRGFTLAELAVSMAIMAMLMGAMTSTIIIASHAIPDSQDPAVKKLEATDVVDQLAGELFYATAITEASANAVTFTVADRGHGAAGPETIRYAWSGTPGDPLRRQYNDGTVISVCEGTDLLRLTFDKRAGRLDAPPRVLLIVDDAANMLADEAARKTTIEGWGFAVQPVSSWITQVDFDAATANNDVVYISMHANAGDVAALVADSPLGIVNEVTSLYDELGVAQSGTFYNNVDLNILDNEHEITSVFPVGTLRILSSADEFAVTTATVSAGTQVLAVGGIGGDPSLQILDVGAELYGGGTANSRRVCLPWAGWKTFDFNKVNKDGLTLMRRSIVWAAAPVVYSGVGIVLKPTTKSERVRTTVQVLNMPRVNTP